ncbi:hypothetical protein QR685DRAFT_570019 [Neurospora intermedia]|uniref:Questionable protein n=1 Tax=Neurospora intermedia TaxID=5142 RepID=A0ABR3DN04_NEUIN
MRVFSSGTFVARNQQVMKARLTVNLTASWHVQIYLQSYIVPVTRHRSRLGFFESRTCSTRGPEASKAEQSKHGTGSTSTDSQHLSHIMPCGAWPMTSPPAGSNSAIRQTSQWE